MRLVPGSTPLRTVGAIATADQIGAFAGFVKSQNGVSAGGAVDLAYEGIAYVLCYGVIAAGTPLVPSPGNAYCVFGTSQPVAVALEAKAGAATTGLVRSLIVPHSAVVTSRRIPVAARDLRVWDAPSTVAVAATAANDDLAVVYNTLGTLPATIETGDLKNAGATTRKVGWEFVVPDNYVPGQSLVLRIPAGMKTTVASTAATVDVNAYRKAAPTVDICATDAQSINSLTEANKDFVLTPTNVVPGEVIDVVISVTVNDTGTGTAVIGRINTAGLEVQATCKA